MTCAVMQVVGDTHRQGVCLLSPFLLPDTEGRSEPGERCLGRRWCFIEPLI